MQAVGHDQSNNAVVLNEMGVNKAAVQHGILPTSLKKTGYLDG